MARHRNSLGLGTSSHKRCGVDFDFLLPLTDETFFPLPLAFRCIARGMNLRPEAAASNFPAKHAVFANLWFWHKPRRKPRYEGAWWLLHLHITEIRLRSLISSPVPIVEDG